MDVSALIVKAVKVLIPMILALTFHEFAHAFAANRLGDRTAEEQGRMTLNPMSHIDPIGTIFLPLMILLSSGGALPFFGWAKPVPYNPNRFRRGIQMRTGAMLVAAAGPVSNVVFALALTIGYGLLARFGVMLPEGLREIVVTLIQINVALAIFNLLPFPPLDGAKVLLGFLSRPQADAYEAVMARAGIFILIGIVALGGRILAYPMTAAFQFLVGVVLPFSAGV